VMDPVQAVLPVARGRDLEPLQRQIDRYELSDDLVVIDDQHSPHDFLHGGKANPSLRYHAPVRRPGTAGEAGLAGARALRTAAAAPLKAGAVGRTPGSPHRPGSSRMMPRLRADRARPSHPAAAPSVAAPRRARPPRGAYRPVGPPAPGRVPPGGPGRAGRVPLGPPVPAPRPGPVSRARLAWARAGPPRGPGRTAERIGKKAGEGGRGC